ncbi:MAG: type II toxin-antitoxin system mRNA interferase toxin, RelE/StbE family [bacterium]|nr:type II toxin-antitoxin system mRNA interferase toxin, RelE/StbE family [bacterium]
MKITAILLHRLFEKGYKRQDQKVKQGFKEKRDLLLIDPSHPLLNNHPLHGVWIGHWSINITGNIRVVYKIEQDIAIFVAIGTHSELYG